MSGVLLLLLYNQLAIVTLYQRVVNSAIDKRVVCDDCLRALLSSTVDYSP